MAGSSVAGTDPHRHTTRGEGGRFAATVPPPDGEPQGDPPPPDGEPAPAPRPRPRSSGARKRSTSTPPAAVPPAPRPSLLVRLFRDGLGALRGG